jgi:hypothetical protein
MARRRIRLGSPNDPCSPNARLCDLMKQGFWKPTGRAKKIVKNRPTVTCDPCMNWHPEGKHTAPAAVRRANEAARRARTGG